MPRFLLVLRGGATLTYGTRYVALAGKETGARGIHREPCLWRASSQQCFMRTGGVTRGMGSKKAEWEADTKFVRKQRYTIFFKRLFYACTVSLWFPCSSAVSSATGSHQITPFFLDILQTTAPFATAHASGPYICLYTANSIHKLLHLRG